MVLDLADRNAVQIHRRARGERGGVGHIGINHGVRFEDIGVARDQKNQNRQDHHGKDGKNPHFESRPAWPWSESP